MIRMDLTLEQDGQEINHTVRALTNETTTPAEERTMAGIIETLQKRIADQGGSAEFVMKLVELPVRPGCTCGSQYPNVHRSDCPMAAWPKP